MGIFFGLIHAYSKVRKYNLPLVIKGSTLNLWDDKKFLFTAVKYNMIQEISAFLRNTCILAIYIDKRVWEILSPKTCIHVYNIHVLGFFPPHFSLLFLISMQISLNMFHSCLVKNKMSQWSRVSWKMIEFKFPFPCTVSLLPLSPCTWLLQ